MGIMRKLAGLGVLLFVSLVPISAAHADCAPYCGPNGPSTPIGPNDSGAVLPSEAEQTPPTTVAEVAPAESEQPAAPAVAETPAPAAVESAPTGSLPFTGGDIAGITVIGIGAVGIGTLMVRRSRTVRAVA